MSKILSIEDLIARKQQSDSDKIKIKEVHIEEMGGAIKIRKMPIMQVAKIMDKAENAESVSENLEINIELVYKCCPVFQSKELQEAHSCAEPYDVVMAVLDDNIGVLNQLASEILGMYGLDKENLKNEIKN